MGYAQDTGYIASTVSEIIDLFRVGVNTQFGTTYTKESFEGTNLYKYYYASAQRLAENEIKTAEIFLKLQQYISIINERISRPVATNPGMIEKFLSLGYVASVKPMIEADAGKISVAVDLLGTEPTYAVTKAAIGLLLNQITVGGTVTMGDQVSTIVLTNGQAFDYKFFLPNRIATRLKLTLTLSENNQLVVGSQDDSKIKLLSNINQRYWLGKNFEPQRYFAQADAPWTGSVKLEYSIDAGSTWLTNIYDADFDDLLEIGLADITVIEV